MCKKPQKKKGGSSGGEGKKPEPQPTPKMKNLVSTGFWGADYNGQASPALVEKVLAGGYCNTVMLKKRMADQGSLSSMIEVGVKHGAKFVLISQDYEAGVDKEAEFIETCISILTPARIVGIICGLDEWDLNPYIGHIAEIENYVAAIKARAQGIPVGINFSLGYGLTPACGAESILEIDRSNPDPTQWQVVGVKGRGAAEPGHGLAGGLPEHQRLVPGRHVAQGHQARGGSFPRHNQVRHSRSNLGGSLPTYGP